MPAWLMNRLEKTFEVSSAAVRLGGDGPSGGAETVGHATVEGGLGAHHRETDVLPLGEGQHALNVGGLNRRTVGNRGDSWIPRGANDTGDLRVPGQAPSQGVLPPAPPNDKDVHDRDSTRPRGAAKARWRPPCRP